jgi:large subunit ribosomal protein L15
MIRLHNLRPRPGSRHRVKRLGIGESSGHGKTSGKGHKGQKARSGGSIRLGFEGGQMPLIRRLPKRGFNNAAFHKSYAIVNLNDLNRFDAGTDVNEQSLRAAKLIRGNFFGVKVLGDGELKHALNIEVDKISTSAREKIEKAGGKIMMRERTAVRAQAESSESPVDESKDAPKLKKTKKTAAKKAVAKKSASKKKR